MLRSCLVMLIALALVGCGSQSAPKVNHLTDIEAGEWELQKGGDYFKPLAVFIEEDGEATQTVSAFRPRSLESSLGSDATDTFFRGEVDWISIPGCRTFSYTFGWNGHVLVICSNDGFVFRGEIKVSSDSDRAILRGVAEEFMNGEAFTVPDGFNPAKYSETCILCMKPAPGE